MADRIIRDELLTSERYWSVSIEARELFIHVLLNADDTARFSGNNYTIRTACYPGQSVNPEKLEGLLSSLHDADLVRFYEAGGLRFIFIPRFKQRLRFTKSKYPAPPNGISDLHVEKSDSGKTISGTESDHRPQKRSEVKRSEENTPPKSPPRGTSGEKGSTSKPSQWFESEEGIEAKGKELGIEARPGESWPQYKRRLFEAMKGRQSA